MDGRHDHADDEGKYRWRRNLSSGDDDDSSDNLTADPRVGHGAFSGGAATSPGPFNNRVDSKIGNEASVGT